MTGPMPAPPRRAEAVSLVHTLGCRDDGSPIPAVTSAVCAVCEAWATRVWISGRTDVVDPDDLADRRVKRSVQVTAYACATHSQVVADGLVAEYGSVSNSPRSDDLAWRVRRRGRRS